LPRSQPVKAAYEKAIGHATSDSTVYNLLHRRGWRKLMPRPYHPKRDLAADSLPGMRVLGLRTVWLLLPAVLSAYLAAVPSAKSADVPPPPRPPHRRPTGQRFVSPFPSRFPADSLKRVSARSITALV
jgi:hypothetical protein